MKKVDIKATIEAVKEVARWVLLMVVSWIVTETLKQVGLVPETHTLHVWVFSYSIPVRVVFQTGLTLLGKGVDKWLYERGKTLFPFIKGATGLTGI